MKVQIKITNLPQIRSAFIRSPRIMARELDRAIKKAVLLIEKDSRAVTPVRTGFLRASHISNFGSLKGSVEVRAKYAPYVHFGTRFQRAQPFLQKSVDKNQSKVEQEFKRAVENTLNWIARHGR